MPLRVTALRLVDEHPLLSPIGAPSGTNLPFGQSPRELYALFSKIRAPRFRRFRRVQFGQ